jgi:hypothetical protein
MNDECVMWCRGITLDGAMNGIKYYVTPNLSILFTVSHMFAALPGVILDTNLLIWFGVLLCLCLMLVYVW